MAPIGRRLFVIGGLMTTALKIRGDDSADVHTVIGQVADSLTSGEATQAMSGFSKTCAAYQKLTEYFDALTSAYFVENRLEFLDEETSSTAATLALRWDLALTTRQSGFTKNRTAELTVKLAREGRHWRITDFRPIEIFDPQSTD